MASAEIGYHAFIVGCIVTEAHLNPISLVSCPVHHDIFRLLRQIFVRSVDVKSMLFSDGMKQLDVPAHLAGSSTPWPDSALRNGKFGVRYDEFGVYLQFYPKSGTVRAGAVG